MSAPDHEPASVADLLRASPALAESPGLVDAAAKVFDYAQYLLDDDENLTRTGALNGAARQRLRERITELLTAQQAQESISEPETDEAT